jgi:outer membrane protein assembly factor BamB
MGIHQAWHRLLAAAVLLAAAGAAAAHELPPVLLSGQSGTTAKRLAEARRLIADKEFAEALPVLEAVLDSAGSDLVALDEGRSVEARRLCHVLLARLPAEALKQYRNRAEPQAGKWLAQGIEERDPAVLTKLVDVAFCTRAAEQALDRLGDWAFERGQFDEAESWWRLLAPLRPAAVKEADDPAALAYPGPTGDVARVRAKQLLARLFQTPAPELPPNWAAEVKAFARRHPRAEGALAGRTGNYVETLTALGKERSRRPAAMRAPWPTFGGSTQRGRVAAAPPRLLDHLGMLCRGGPTWRFDLEARAKIDGQEAPFGRKLDEVGHARRLAFYPVVADKYVLASDGRYVTAYDVQTGQASDWYDAGRFSGGIGADLSLPAPMDLRYSLTVAEGCVFARLGTQYVQDVRPGEGRGAAVRARASGESLLVCLSLKPGRSGDRRRWLAKAIDLTRKDYSVFEGAPVVGDGRVFIAATRFEGDKVITAVHCYPVDPEDTEPTLLWRADLCETRELLPAARDGRPAPGSQRARHHLLTLAGGRVFYCSHSGAVVALDTRTGRRAWAVRYPRRATREPEDEPQLRDLAPCLYADGLLYVAPSDSEWLLCLDPATGRTVWERRGLEAVHLLGVGQGRLIFSTRRNPGTGRLHGGGLRAVGAADGADAMGWKLPDDGGGLVPLGRGLLVGDLVLWPTARKPYGVFAVRQEDGHQPDNPTLLHRIPSGNLAFGDGILVVTDLREMAVFVPPGMLLEEAEKEAKAEPESARAQLILARARADRGRVGEALQAFAAAEKLTAGAAGYSAKQTRRAAQAERHELALTCLEQSVRGKRWKDADAIVKQTAAVPPRARLRSLVRAAGLWREAGDLKRAADAWRAVLAAEELRDLAVEDANGLPSAAGAAASAALRALGKADGGAVSGKSLNGAMKVAARKESDVTVPLRPRWQIDLAADEWFLPPGVEGAVLPRFVWAARQQRSRGELVCRSPSDGKEVWACRLPFVPEWVGLSGAVVVAGGAGGVAGVRCEDGQRMWLLPAPVQGRYPASPQAGETGVRVVTDALRPEPLAEFRLAGGRVVCLQGERRLLVIEAKSGRVLWQRLAPGAEFAAPFPFGRFAPGYYAGPETILAQASGRSWTLDTAGGRVLAEAPSPIAPWARRPVAVDAETVCLVPDARSVAFVQASTGGRRWTFTLSRSTLLSGEPPLVVGKGDNLLVVIPGNIGCRLQRLDRKTGKPLWRQAPLLQFGRLFADGWLTDARAVYYSDSEGVCARSLIDGKVLWQKSLPGGPWRLVRAGGHLLATPADARAAGLRFRSPFGSLQWQGGPLASGYGVPVVALDSRTGVVAQHLNLDPGGARVRFSLHPADGGGRWGIRADDRCPGAQVGFIPGGVLVVLGRRIWGLAPDS